MSLDVLSLIAVVVAAIVFFRLRMVVGRRTDDDEARIERYRSQRAQQQQQQAAQNDGKVVTLPRREAVPATAEPARESNADRDLRMTKFAGGNAPLARGLIDIASKDQGFDPAEFMKGAKAAYEMIVMGFAEGNRNMLHDLLSPEVFSGFAQAIHQREEARQKVEQSFVGISAADMIEAEIVGPSAQVTVKFVSELISAVRNAADEVVSGDPKRIKEVTDIWTFARDLTSRDPNWRVVATQAAN